MAVAILFFPNVEILDLAGPVGGAPFIPVFSILHGAGNGILTIARGTLPLGLLGPDGYRAQVGRISMSARIGQALAPFLFGLAIERYGKIVLIMSSALSVGALITVRQLSSAALSRPPL